MELRATDYLGFLSQITPQNSLLLEKSLQVMRRLKVAHEPNLPFSGNSHNRDGNWTYESHRHCHTASIAASTPCPFPAPKGMQTPVRGVCKLWYDSENAIYYLQCHLELLVNSFASVLQFRSVKFHTLWHSKQQKHLVLLVLDLLESWQHLYLSVLSGCTIAVCAIRFHSSCSSRDFLSHWVAWKLLNAWKINEKITLVGWPEQLSRLSRSGSCPAVALALLLICSAALDRSHLFIKLEEKNE